MNRYIPVVGECTQRRRYTGSIHRTGVSAERYASSASTAFRGLANSGSADSKVNRRVSLRVLPSQSGAL